MTQFVKRMMETREIADPHMRTAIDAGGVLACIHTLIFLVVTIWKNRIYMDISTWVVSISTALLDVFGGVVAIIRLIRDIRELKNS